MNWILCGAVYCAIAIAAGAFGAHGLKARLSPEALSQWETAARYLMYGGLGILLSALFDQRLAYSTSQASLALAIGGAVFSLAVGTIALGGPKWFGAIAPLGGAGLILGFVLLAIAGWRG